MQLPIAKPLLIAVIAIIAVIGVGAGVMLSEQTPQGPQITRPVPSQTQEQLNDSQMMENLNKSPEELTDDQKGYQGDEDISSEKYDTLELTSALNYAYKSKPKTTVKKVVKKPAKPAQKPTKPVTPKPPANNDNINNNNDNGDNITDPGEQQIEEEWDPFEDPGTNPDADDYDEDGSDSGEDQSSDSLV